MQIAILAILAVLASSAASVFLKAATQTSGALVDVLMNWRLVVGLGLFAGAALFYVMLLQRLPLSAAQSFMAIQYIIVPAASVLLLGEVMPPLRLLGIVLVATGIVLVAVSL